MTEKNGLVLLKVCVVTFPAWTPYNGIVELGLDLLKLAEQSVAHIDKDTG
jgi:hypothetical protein